jgi:hypothetical protein
VIIYQPSTITNKSSLNGKEIKDGGIIIIPMESNTDETTISMIKKGT